MRPNYFCLFFWDIWHGDLLRLTQGCFLALHMSFIILIIIVGAPNHLIYGTLLGVVEQNQHQICKAGARGLENGRRKQSAAGSEQALHDSVVCS